MQCLKCGRKTDSQAVFCEACAQRLAQHPVKPDAVVQLPARALLPYEKSVPTKRPVSPEEQLAGLHRQNRRLKRLIAGLCVGLALLAALWAVQHFQPELPSDWGRNYTVDPR